MLLSGVFIRPFLALAIISRPFLALAKALSAAVAAQESLESLNGTRYTFLLN